MYQTEIFQQDLSKPALRRLVKLIVTRLLPFACDSGLLTFNPALSTKYCSYQGANDTDKEEQAVQLVCTRLASFSPEPLLYTNAIVSGQICGHFWSNLRSLGVAMIIFRSSCDKSWTVVASLLRLYKRSFL